MPRKNKQDNIAYQKLWRAKNPDKQSEYYKKNLEKERERHARWYAKVKADPVALEASRRRHKDYQLKLKFGITIDDYDRMLKEQGGVCKICLRPPGKQALSVDHDHKLHGPASVRGLLCHMCNRGLPWFRDSAESLERASRYLKKEL